MKRKLLRGLSIALLTVLLTLVVGVLAIRWLRPKVIHQRPYKWDAFVLPMMNFTNEPIVNVVKASLHELASGGARGGGRAPEPKVIGELKQDPVCGTYISTETEFKKKVKGEAVYFCSAICRDKYR